MVQENIDQLAPVIPPETVSFWPLQPGWYIVSILFLILVAYVFYRIFKRYRRNAYRKQALNLLQEMEQIKTENRLGRLNYLLKATALKAYPRAEAAGLYGQEWLEFLSFTGGNLPFTEAPYQYLASSDYSGTSSLKQEEWTKIAFMAKNWIEKHKSFDKSKL